jgi:hypothetical protein
MAQIRHRPSEASTLRDFTLKYKVEDLILAITGFGDPKNIFLIIPISFSVDDLRNRNILSFYLCIIY